MGVDLRLERLDPGLLQCLLLLIGAFKLVFQFCGHGVKVAEECLKLPAIRLLGDAVAPFSLLQMAACRNEGVHGLCHKAAKQQHHNE